MTYVDFAYYSEVYGGNLIPENKFTMNAKKASSIISAAIFGREIPEDLLEKVKDCCCEIAEKVHIYEEFSHSENRNISSEKIGNYSVSYQNNSESTVEFSKSCYAVICRYFGNTGLLYRGVD